MGKFALKIWENQYKIIKKIPQKKLQEKLALAILDYAFTGEHEKVGFPLDAILQGMYADLELKNQGGAPTGNKNNRYTTVEQPLNNRCINVDTTVIQPLTQKEEKKKSPLTPLEEKNKNIPLDNNKLLSCPQRKFHKPTVEEINTYCRERNNRISAEEFFNFYESKGWLIGKSPMKDWKAAVRTWESKDKQNWKIIDAEKPDAFEVFSQAMGEIKRRAAQ